MDNNTFTIKKTLGWKCGQAATTEMPLEKKLSTADTMTRPICSVRGLVQPNAMCGHIYVGGKVCGYGGGCEHQVQVPEIEK